MGSKKRSIAVLVYATALIQVLGFCFKVFSEGSSLAQFLTNEYALTSATRLLIDEITIGVLVLSLLWTFFNWNPWPFIIMGSVFLIEAVATSVAATDSSSLVAFASEAVRYLWLFVMGYALRLERTLDIELSLPSVRLYLRYALAISLATVGLEALFQLPEFFAVIQAANQKIPGLPVDADFLRNQLYGIGAVNLVLAFLLIFKPIRSTLLTTFFWCLGSALALIWVAPQTGLYEALLRAPHYFLPLLILSVEGKKTISPRRMYLRMLKKIRAQQHALRSQTRSFVRRT